MIRIFASLFFAMAMTSFAAIPFVTVPWNGHRAAVSFTFDDGLASQPQNLKPILDTMPEAHVTFFMAGASYLQQDVKGFAALANAGHEIGSHSYSHQKLDTIADFAELEKEVIGSASDIESMLAAEGANITVTAFATPFCAKNDDVISMIDKRYFLNRNCGWHGRVNWSTTSDVFNLWAKGWNRSMETAESMCASLDTAAVMVDTASMESWLRPGPEGSWLVVLTHGVADDDVNLSASPKDMEAMIRHALENDMWVTTFSSAGAYYLAHFTLDTVSAVKSDSRYTLQWEMPHSNMPKSIPVKVILNAEFLAETGWSSDASVVLEQGEELLWPDEQNRYTLEFAKKSVVVREATQAEIAGRDSSKTDDDDGGDEEKKLDDDGEGDSKKDVDDDNGKKPEKEEEQAILPRSLPTGLGLPKQYFDLKGRTISPSNKSRIIRVQR